MTDRLMRRQLRIARLLHSSTPEQLLLHAILSPGDGRELVEKELQRRAYGEVPANFAIHLAQHGQFQAAA